MSASVPVALRLTGARIVDGTGVGPVPDGVVTSDARGDLTYVGPAAGAPPTPGAQVVDVAGRTVLPGFFDCHVHVLVDYTQPLLDRMTKFAEYAVFEAGARLHDTLMAGVTTVRDLGGIGPGARRAVADGLVVGPRLQVAHKLMSHTGGHADPTLPNGAELSDTGLAGVLVDSAADVLTAARALVRSGVDVVKVCATGGMSSPSDSPDDEGLSREEIAVLVDELRRHGGLPVAAHAQGLAGIRNAIVGGVTSIEHGYGIDDEACSMCLDRGTFLNPTLSTVFTELDPDRMASYYYEKKVRWQALTQENIAHAIERGVRIGLGTDSGMIGHGQNLRELEYLCKLGMSPMAAIEAGTRVSAEQLGVQDRLGTLEAGKIADLVVCDGDPLTDVSVLGRPDNVVLVVQGGVLRKDTLPRSAA